MCRFAGCHKIKTRITQTHRAVATYPIAPNTKHLSGSLEIVRHPVTDTRIHQGVHRAHVMASGIPTGFAFHAALKFPRTIFEKLVVIPQWGQSNPVSVRNVQAGNPSCW